MVDNKVRKRVSLKRLGGNAVKGFVITWRARSASFSSVPKFWKVRCCLPGLWEDAAGQGGSDGGLCLPWRWPVRSLWRSRPCAFVEPLQGSRRPPPEGVAYIEETDSVGKKRPTTGPASATRRRGGVWTSFCENGWTVHHRPRQSPGVHQLNWHFWQRSAEARPTSQAFSTFPRGGKCRRFSSGTWKGRRWSGSAEFICVACQLKGGLSCAGVAGLCSEASRELQEDRAANLEFSLSRCPEEQDPLRGWQEAGCVSRVRPCFVWLAARAHCGCGERRHRATDKRRTGLGSEACERPSLLHQGAAGGEGVQGPRRPHVVRDHLLQKDPFPGTGHPEEGHPHRPLRGGKQFGVAPSIQPISFPEAPEGLTVTGAPSVRASGR